MSPKPFRSDFFQIVGDGWDEQRITSVMRTLAALPNDDRDARGFKRNGAWLRLQEFRELEPTLWAGEIMRVRQDEPAKKGDPDGKVEQIPMGPGQGLAFDTAFLVSSKYRTLVMQHNHFGASASVVESLVHANDRFDPAFNVKPLMRQDSNDRFLKGETITKLRLRFAAVADPKARKALGLSIDSSIEFMDELEGAHINIEVGRGHSLGSLKKGALTRFIEKLQAQKHEELEAIEVTIKDENSDKAVIDLISQRLFVETTLTPNERGEMPFVVRYRALKEAFDAHFGYLKSLK